MFDFTEVFSYNYIFEYIPQWNPKYSWIIWAIYGGVLILGFVLILFDRITPKNKFFIRHLKNRLLPLTNTVGFTGLILTFFRYQAIPYLSTRFLVYCLIIISLIWAVFIIIFFIRKYPQDKLEAKIEYRKNRYLKKKKK
ncbi:hypothetical protein ACFL14_02620 [Patescibacteria group bacterium]